ncbi:MAG: hypothetical protein ACLRO0_09845, partial [Massilimicrobiota timonensis]
VVGLSPTESVPCPAHNKKLDKKQVFQPVALSSSPFLMNGSPSEQALTFYHTFFIRQVIVTMILTFLQTLLTMNSIH